MSLTKNISHIKNLGSIQPDKKWEKTTKFDLLDEISSQNRLMKAYKLSTAQQIDFFMMRAANRLAPSMRRVLATFLVFMMFFGINIAAQASVPGEPLWPVKRSIEEAELSLTFSTVKKTEVHIKHVNERLAEIDKILDKPTDASVPETKVKTQKAIKTAVSHLEKDVTSVDSSLKIAKEEDGALEVVELVKKVTDATKEIATQLKETKKEVVAVVDDETIADAIDEAKVANKKVKKSAVSVALQVHEELTKAVEDTNTVSDQNSQDAPVLMLPQNIDGSESGAVKDSETTTYNIINGVNKAELKTADIETITNIVKEIVASEINEASVEVKDVKQKAEVVGEEELEKIKQDNLQDKSMASNKKVATSELEEIDTIKKASPEETEVILNEAKVLLDSGMLKDAFEKVSAVQEKYEKAEATLEKIEKVKSDVKGTNSNIDSSKTSEQTAVKNNVTIPSNATTTGAQLKKDVIEVSAVGSKEE